MIQTHGHTSHGVLVSRSEVLCGLKGLDSLKIYKIRGIVG
jgi:hypothetical protein